MPVSVRCPNPLCGKTFDVPNGLSGRSCRCPSCAGAVTLSPTVAGVDTVGPSGPAPPRGGIAWPFLRPPLEADEIGRLGGYRVLGEVGRGGMGVVFRAEDPGLRRLVALKVMLPEAAEHPTGRPRFLREARAVAALHHDHVVSIYQVGEDNGVPFLVMPLLRGESLEKRLEREGRLPVAEVLRVGREIAAALAAAHEQGLIHRDVKPSNVWLEAPSGRVKVLDFGLVLPQDVDSEMRLTRLGRLLGTPSYLAPEQTEGKVDARSDLFSLGCVLYETATGRKAFDGPHVGIILACVRGVTPRTPAALVPALPAALSDLIMDLLCKRPEGRPPTAQAVVQRCAALQKTLGVPRGPVPKPARRPRPKRARPAARAGWRPSLVALVGGLVVLALVLAGFWLDHLRRSRRPPAEEPALTEQRPGKDRRSLAPGEDKPFGGEPQPGGGKPSAGEQQPGRALPGEVADTSGSWPWAEERATLRGHASNVYALAFSPDGKTLASGSLDQTVKLWDVASGQERASLKGDTGYVLSVAFSPDGKTLASGSKDRTVELWDEVGGRERSALQDHQCSVDGLAFSPDGKTLASGSYFEIKLRDAVSGRERASLPGNLGYVWSVAFSPDGKTLASADLAVHLWDTASGRERATLWGHTSYVRSVAFSPDGKTLASGSLDGTIKLWDVASGQERATLHGHTGAVYSVAFSPDGKTLASGGLSDCTVKLWDVSSGQERASLTGHTEGVHAVAFSPDGKTLASASNDGTIKLWEACSRPWWRPRARH